MACRSGGLGVRSYSRLDLHDTFSVLIPANFLARRRKQYLEDAKNAGLIK
jgi:hypothetical protein